MVMRAKTIRIHCESRLSGEAGIDKIAGFASEHFASSSLHIINEHTVGRVILDAHDPAVAAAQIPDAGDVHGQVRKCDTGSTGLHTGAYDTSSLCDTPCEPALYDGFALCNAAADAICESYATRAFCPCGQDDALDIILTDLLPCTFDYNNNDDDRYHARMLVGANPFIVSIQGIVDAPARPRGYYFEDVITRTLKGMAENAGEPNGMQQNNAPHAMFQSEQKKYDYVIRHDPRIPDILEGLILQAVTYYETGDAFCTDSACRMYNAHWQSDLVRTQVTNPALCKTHQNVINAMRGT